MSLLHVCGHPVKGLGEQSAWSLSLSGSVGRQTAELMLQQPVGDILADQAHPYVVVEGMVVQWDGPIKLEVPKDQQDVHIGIHLPSD